MDTLYRLHIDKLNNTISFVPYCHHPPFKLTIKVNHIANKYVGYPLTQETIACIEAEVNQFLMNEFQCGRLKKSTNGRYTYNAVHPNQ